MYMALLPYIFVNDKRDRFLLSGSVHSKNAVPALLSENFQLFEWMNGTQQDVRSQKHMFCGYLF